MRAVAIARSPSAGFPIAIEVTIDAGRTGETRRSSANAEATGEQPSAWPPKSFGCSPEMSPSRSNCWKPCQTFVNIAPGADRHHDRAGVSQPSCSLSSNASVFEPSA